MSNQAQLKDIVKQVRQEHGSETTFRLFFGNYDRLADIETNQLTNQPIKRTNDGHERS